MTTLGLSPLPKWSLPQRAFGWTDWRGCFASSYLCLLHLLSTSAWKEAISKLYQPWWRHGWVRPLLKYGGYLSGSRRYKQVLRWNFKDKSLESDPQVRQLDAEVRAPEKEGKVRFWLVGRGRAFAFISYERQSHIQTVWLNFQWWCPNYLIWQKRPSRREYLWLVLRGRAFAFISYERHSHIQTVWH